MRTPRGRSAAYGSSAAPARAAARPSQRPRPGQQLPRPTAIHGSPVRPSCALALPSPAHASSAIACSVNSASQTRQSRPSARASSGRSARSSATLHASASRPGAEPRRSSTHAPQPPTRVHHAPDQSAAPAGGHRTPAGGDNAKRNASERPSSTLSRANTSGGQSSRSSVNPAPDTACQAEASVTRSAAPLCRDHAHPCPRYVIGRCGDSAPTSTTARLLSLAERAGRIAALQLTLPAAVRPAVVGPMQTDGRSKKGYMSASTSTPRRPAAGGLGGRAAPRRLSSQPEDQVAHGGRPRQERVVPGVELHDAASATGQLALAARRACPGPARRRGTSRAPAARPLTAPAARAPRCFAAPSCLRPLVGSPDRSPAETSRPGLPFATVNVPPSGSISRNGAGSSPPNEERLCPTSGR